MPDITVPFSYYDENDDEVTVQLPACFDVCDRCEGHGSHLNPSIGSHAYTREEFEESFDEEQAEEYFKRGGIYDVTCEECRGARVVPVVDESKCKPELLKLYHEQRENRARWDAEDRYTRRMESGGFDY